MMHRITALRLRRPPYRLCIEMFSVFDPRVLVSLVLMIQYIAAEHNY